MKRRRVLSALMAAVLTIGTVGPTLPTAAAEGEVQQLSEDAQTIEVYEEPAEVYEEPAEVYEDPAEVPAEEPAEEPTAEQAEPEITGAEELPGETYVEPEAGADSWTDSSDDLLIVDDGADLSIPVVNDGDLIIEGAEWIDEDPGENKDEEEETEDFGIEIEAITEVETDDEIMPLAVGDTCAFAFYCADDGSLNFYYGPQPEEGDQYEGKTVKNVYTGFDTATYKESSLAPWNSIRSSFTSVVIDESFSNVKPKSMAYWFYYFENCVEFIGLENIDTSSVTTMADTFRGCYSVTSLDITSWNTSSVTTMAQMFMYCKSATSLKVDGIDTSNVTTMNGMFRYLDALTEIDLSGWDTSNVTTINAFIRDNGELTTIYADRDWTFANGANIKNMFRSDDKLVGGNGTKCLDSDGKSYGDGVDEVSGERARIDGGDDKPGYFTDVRTITTVNVTGTKVWDDADNQDGIRPESVTVHLLANGDETDSITVTADDDWSFTFSGLPEYDDDLNEIPYTITEDAVEGYTSEITGDVGNGFVITNSYTPTKKDVSGTITWADGNNQDGKRPNYVAVQLIAQDAAGGTLDTWEFEIHAPENPTYDNDGNEIWTWTQNDLDHYYNGGNEVKYSVIYIADLADGYTQSNPNDLDTVYSYTPETTTISGIKTWVDDGNAQNTRPESITIRLHADNQVVVTQVISSEDGGAWTFSDLPVYNNGHEIHYTITEDAVENYVAEYDGYNVKNTLHDGETSVTILKDWEDENDQDGIRPDNITVALLADGNPAVDENGNPETLTLVDDGHGIWEGTFEEIANNSDGSKIVYTIQELTVTDKNGNNNSYTVEISGDATEGFVITNSYTPEKIDVTGTKVWEDTDDQDGMRPSSIYVHLLANGSSVDDVQVSSDENGNWMFAFNDVPKCANGSEIEYTVEEVLNEPAADAYSASYTGDTEKGLIITNTHTPEMLNGDGTLTVTKVWDDDDNRDGLRPADVTINLLANGETIDSAALGSSAGDAWTATFTDLPKYADGKEIAYTVTEDSIESYTAAVTGSVSEGYTVTNTHTPATINMNVAKVWEDEENQDGKRPVSITVNLLADDEPALDRNGNAISAVLNDDDDWEEPFMNLYQYRDGGTEIVYTIEEDTSDIADIYTSTKTGDMSSGFTITNSYTPELYNGDGTFKVVVVWDDEANNDGIRPEEVNITLVKDNTAVDGATMSLTGEETDADGNWIGTFTELPKYENGSEIVYSVKEDYKSGYTYRVELLTDEDGKTYVQLTNVHVSVKEDIEVTKVWDDHDNQDGKRPDSITIRLLTNGNLYKTVTLTAESDGVTVSENGNVWKYTMKDIPVDKNGVNIEYTMIEVDVEGYVTPEIEVIRGDEITDNGVTYQPYSFVVTNSHTPEQITVSGTKVWDDADNQDGKRPQFVTLNLLADGKVVETIDVSTDDEESDDENVWDWAFQAHDKYKDGKEIEYTVTEDTEGTDDSGYKTVITGSAADGFTITNSYTPETTTISGSKTWVDEDAAETDRPESITVRLHANGSEKVYEKVITEADDWKWEFTDLPVYSNGHPITYTLTEDALDNYDVEYTHGEDGTLNVVNTIDPGNTSVTVEKDWEDADNQDGIRPEFVTVYLLADDEQVKDENGNPVTLTLSDENYWEDTFHHLPEYDNGVRINYEVQEVNVEGYNSVITGNETEGFVITNSHTPETVDISGSKVWEDNDNQDGIRPDSITVHLMNGEETLESHTVSAENDWTFTFAYLDKYADGQKIAYTIEEAYTAEGYTAEVDGYTITNTHTPEKIDIAGIKTWEDDDNRDGIRPGSVTIYLWADGQQVRDAEGSIVSAAVPDTEGNWTYTFADYDKYSDGKEIRYSITEDVPEGYHASYDYFDYDVENTHSPALLNGDGTLGVIMRWEDEGDQDGLRPAQTTITLMLNDVPDETMTLVLSDANTDENGNWIGMFEDLYKYADGEEIAYNVEEGVMNGYTYTAELVCDEDTGLYYIEITNTHAAVTSDITVTKVWDDNDNQDGIRPDSVVVNLFSNGSAVKSVTIKPGNEGVTVSDDGNEWSYTIENLPVDQNGEAIIYSLDEVDVGSYSHEIKTKTVGDNEKDGVTYTKYDFTVTNSHTPETVEVSGEKIWDDADNQDGIRPGFITIELLADGKFVTDENGDPVTAKVTEIVDEETVTSDSEGSWTWTFTNLPKYRDGGTEIVYSFEEIAVEGYETAYSADGRTITNTHIPETTTISGNKVWVDEDGAEEYRPDHITVNLYTNGLLKESRDVYPDSEGRWEWTFEDLPVYANGQKITYVTTETAIDNYNTSYSGFSLINTLAPGETSVTVVKDWEDEDDQDGKRPESVTVNLMKVTGYDTDGTPILEQAKDHDGNDAVIALTAEDQWMGTFTKIDEYEEGNRIEYTVEEASTDEGDYTTEISGDMSEGFVITNSYTPETVSVSGSKAWDDNNNQDGARPENLTVNLLADGTVTEGMNAKVDEDGNASWTFADLPKYRDGGTEIVYTFSENTVSGYTTEVTGSAEEGYTVTNSHEPELLNGDGTFRVVLTWDDEVDNDGIRPEEVNIKLTKNNTEVEGASLTLTAKDADEDGNWTGTFTGLEKYENGEEISYSVKEDYLSGYTYRIEVKTDTDGNTYVQLTNVHVSVKEDVEVTKIWDDENDQDGRRPEKITVRLLTNGNLYKTVTLSAETDGVTVSDDGNTWTYTMKDIPVDKNGVNIEYTVIEVDVDNYQDPDVETIRGDEITENGVTYQPYSFTITNTHTPEVIDIPTSVEWEDAKNQDGLRPNYVTIHLLADGEIIKSADVSADDDWTFSFTDLPKYDDGKEISYSVALDQNVDEYTAETAENMDGGYVIVLTHTPVTTTISGSKTWVDDNDAEDLRPLSITVRLHANGNEEVYERTVTAADNWAWEFADVPVYSNGHEITYTLTEDAVSDYDTIYSSGEDGNLSVTNTLNPGKTSLTVEKDWEDEDNQDGKRLSEITVELYANGEPAVDENGDPVTLILSEENNWEGTFTALDEYVAGVKIKYTIAEVAANGYESKITGSASAGYVITNTYTPETVDIEGSKIWEDADDQDGIRPESVTIHLLADDEIAGSKNVTEEDDWSWSFTGLAKYADGKVITYSIEEAYTADGYEAAADGYNITNKHTPETVDIEGSKIWDDADDQDGIRPDSITVHLLADGEAVQSKSVTAVDGWSWSFTGLPKYAGGEAITYSIEEAYTADGYEGEVTGDATEGFLVTNTHEPETIEITGSKTWDDADDQDGKRPAEITIRLLADEDEIDSATVTSAEDWSYSFTDLPKYRDGGTEIVYTISEDEVADYETVIDGCDITNTHIPETLEIAGSVSWDDAEDQDGLRPRFVTVQLLADGNIIAATDASEGNGWSFDFADLPKYAGGKEISYSIEMEQDVDGYTTDITENAEGSYEIVAIHTPETVDIEGSKTWDDANDQDGVRPAEITIRLHANGNEKVYEQTVTADGWSWSFTDLPKYEAGVEITYTITEDAVDDYSAAVNGYDVTNSYTPEQTSVTVIKDWEDAHDQDGIRPADITVKLLADGSETDKMLTLSEDNGWEGTFTELNEYSDGKRIEYTVEEIRVDEYESIITGDETEGYVITNTHTPALFNGDGTLEISVDWEDNEDEDSLRPESITIRLFANGEEIDRVTLSEENNWTAAFYSLPMYADGQEIVYTAEEVDISGYDCEVELKQDADGRYYLEVVNTHTTPQTDDPTPQTDEPESEPKQSESEPKQSETEPKQSETEKKETEPAAEKPASTTSSSYLLLRGSARNKTKIDLDWTKVKGADGYILYSAKCGEKMQKTAVIEGRKNNTYTMKNLDPKTAYKFRVKAYKIQNGKRVTVQKSNVVHLYTKGGKYTNVKKVKVSTKDVTLRVGAAKKVKTSVTLVNSSKKLKGHMDYIRYVSTDTSVAKVNKKGKITAVGKGTCYVYAYAADGARKKIKVTVKKAK